MAIYRVHLATRFPDAVTDISGIDVFYIVSFVTYGPQPEGFSTTMKFQCTKSAPNPEFTWIKDWTGDK